MKLRHEEGFATNPGTIPQTAAGLGWPISATKAASLAAAGRFGDETPQRAFDPETQCHPGHVGDGRVGKCAEVLSEPQAVEIQLRNLEALLALGCAKWPAPATLPGPLLLVRPEEPGRMLPGAGFGFATDSGVFTTGDAAVAWLPVGRVRDQGARISLDVSGVRPGEGRVNLLRLQSRVSDALLAAGSAGEGPQWRGLELDLPAELIGPTGVVRLDVALEDVRACARSAPWTATAGWASACTASDASPEPHPRRTAPRSASSTESIAA